MTQNQDLLLIIDLLFTRGSQPSIRMSLLWT